MTILAASTATLAVAGPAAAETVLDEQSRSFSVAHAQGVTVFSRYDQAIDAYHLVAREAGEERRLNVEPSPEAFDVDVGTSATGRLVAVYSRLVNDDPDLREDDHDLFRYSFASDSETRLAALSTEAAEQNPSVSRGQIAFVRYTTEGSRLMIGNTGRNGAPRTLVRRGGDATILDTALSSRRLAYATARGDGEASPYTEAMHVRNLRDGKDRTVKIVRSGTLSYARFTDPSFSDTGKALYFARTHVGAGTGNRYHRWSATQGLRETRGTSQAISTAWAGGSLGMLVVRDPDPGVTCGFEDVETPRGTCDLIATGLLTFTRP
jgi:hypothetical protein